MANRRQRQLLLPLLSIAGLVGCVLLALQGSLRQSRTELYAVENLDGSLAALSSKDSQGLGGVPAGASENLQGSLAGFPNDASETDGSVMALGGHDGMNVDGALSMQNEGDSENSAGVLAAPRDEDVVNSQGVLSAAPSHEGVDYHNGNSAISEMDSYFDSLPTHDVTADHSAPKQHLAQPLQSAPAPVHLASGGFQQARNSDEEWNNKLANMKEAVKLFKTKGDKALEDAVSMGLTSHPVLDGPAQQVSNAEAIISEATHQGGINGDRAKEYAKQVTNLKDGMAKEEKIMQRLNAALAERKKELDEEQEKSAAEEQEKQSANKMDDGYLNFNPHSDHWKYDEFSDFNPPSSGAPTYKYVPGPHARGSSSSIAEFAHGMSKSLSSLKDAITEKQSELVEARGELVKAKQTINDALAAMDGAQGGEQEEEQEEAAGSGEEAQKLALDKKQEQWLGSRPDVAHKADAHDGWLDYNPHSPAWGYDHHLNKNPTGGPPVTVAVDHNMYGGADKIGQLQRPFQPKKVDVEVPSSFQVDEYLDSVSGTHFKKAAPQALRGVTVGGLTKKMRADERGLDAAQGELEDAEGTLAALSGKELRHHLHEQHESVGDEMAWDRRDMALMTHDRRAVDALSREVDRRQRRLSNDVQAMLALKKHKARAAAARDHVVTAGATEAPALGWLKRHVLSGLREKRAIPPHVEGRGFTALKPAALQGGQQLAAKQGVKGGKEASRSLVEAMGVGMCSLLGMACS